MNAGAHLQRVDRASLAPVATSRGQTVVRGLLRVALAVIVIGAAVTLYAFNPASTVWFPDCPFHSMTGFDCPGCGSLRAIHALLNGQLQQAFMHNPLMMLAAPFMMIGVGREAWRWTHGHDPIRWRAPAWSIWTLLLVIVSYGVLRNVPAFAWLSAG